MVKKNIRLQCRRPWFNSWVGKIRWKRDRLPTPVFLGFRCGSTGKESTCNAGDVGSIPRSGRSTEGNSYPLQYFSWKIPWTEEPGWLWSMGVTIRHDSATFTLIVSREVVVWKSGWEWCDCHCFHRTFKNSFLRSGPITYLCLLHACWSFNPSNWISEGLYHL